LGNKKCRIYAACGVSQTPRKYTFERNCINGVAPYLLFTFQAVYLSLFFDAPEAFYRLLSTFYLLGGRFTVIFRCPETFLPLSIPPI